MPRTINPIRKALVKTEYLKSGGNGYKALIAGHCKESTARHSVRANNTLLNVVRAEIQRDILKETTVKKVLEELEELRLLATANKDFSTATRCAELKGKWLSMFTERVEISAAEQPDNQFNIERLGRLRAINVGDKPVNTASQC